MLITKKSKTIISFGFYDIGGTNIHNSKHEIEGDVPYYIPAIGEDVVLTDDSINRMRGEVSQVLRQVTFGSGSVGESVSIILKNSQQT